MGARNCLLILTLAMWAAAAHAQAPLKPATPMMLTWTPAQQRQWYPAMEMVFETRTVAAGGAVHPMPRAAKPIAPTYEFKGRTWTVDDYMAANSVSGLLVLKDGKILLERYGLGRKPEDRWTSFSVAKSITSTLAGAAVRDGRLKLTDMVTAYIPELKGSAYEGVSVHDLMTMSSGVAWNEDYNDPKSDIAQAGVVLEPGVDPYVSYVKRLGRAHPPGTTWHYNTSETDLMGIVVARAAGKPLAAYLSEKIWKPYGMERDAVWMVDRGGLELGGCCISMTLRDYGRVGQFMLDGGMARGKAVLPQGWVGEATKVQIANGLTGYGYFWWIGPEAFEAEGHLWPVDPGLSEGPAGGGDQLGLEAGGRRCRLAGDAGVPESGAHRRRGGQTMTPIALTGGPFERGQAHGAALRGQVQAHLAAWLGFLAESGVDEPAAYVAGLLAATDFRSAIARHTPDLWDEVQGIAAGAEVGPDLLFGLQLLDEEWAYRLRLGRDSKLEKCSSVAIVPASGPTWIGQNMDLGGYTEGFAALLAPAAAPGAPAGLVFTVAGMIGLMGVNAAGVGVCVNSLPQLPSAPQGLPVAFVLRRLLQASSLAEAADLVLSLPHATNQQYLIAGPGGARAFEASAAGVTEYHSPWPDRVLHTNHPLAAEGAPETEAARANSVARLQALEARLSAGDPGLEEIKAALSSCDDPQNPVCRVRRQPGGLAAFTTGSMISALSPGGVESWVSPGPPSRTGYEAFAVA